MSYRRAVVNSKTEIFLNRYRELEKIIASYAHNVRSRNDRKTEHFIITNLPVKTG